MTKIEAETLLYKHLKRFDKHYKDISEIKCTEFKDHFRFGVIYKNGVDMSVYGVFKKSGNVLLAPT